MVSVIAVWDPGDESWTFDCPNCGRTNFFYLGLDEVPEGIEEPRDKLVGKVECHCCHEDSVAVFSLASLRNSSA